MRILDTYQSRFRSLCPNPKGLETPEWSISRAIASGKVGDERYSAKEYLYQDRAITVWLHKQREYACSPSMIVCSGVGRLSTRLEVVQNAYLGIDHQGGQAILCFSTVRQCTPGFAGASSLNPLHMAFPRLLVCFVGLGEGFDLPNMAKIVYLAKFEMVHCLACRVKSLFGR